MCGSSPFGCRPLGGVDAIEFGRITVYDASMILLRSDVVEFGYVSKPTISVSLAH
jgi:hypothetical protein